MDVSGNVRNHFKNHLWTSYHPDTRMTFKEKTFTLNEIVSFKINDEFLKTIYPRHRTNQSFLQWIMSWPSIWGNFCQDLTLMNSFQSLKIPENWGKLFSSYSSYYGASDENSSFILQKMTKITGMLFLNCSISCGFNYIVACVLFI